MTDQETSKLNQAPEKEELARHILYDLAAGMNQYQTIDEMLVYWMDHADELDGQQGAVRRHYHAGLRL